MKPKKKYKQSTDVIDAGMVYGADTATVAALRGAAGYLRLEHGAIAGADDVNHGNRMRSSDSAALTSLHMVFVREHNRLVAALSKQNPDWTSDDLYYAARMRVEAQLQIFAREDERQMRSANGANRCSDESVEYRTPTMSRENVIRTSDRDRRNSLFLIECLRDVDSGRSTDTLAQRDSSVSPSDVGKIDGIEPIRRRFAQAMATA